MKLLRARLSALALSRSALALMLAVLAGCADKRGARSEVAAPPDLVALAASSADGPAQASAAASASGVGLAEVGSASKEPARKPGAGLSALRQGVTLYRAGQYPQAEAQLKQALRAGLSNPKDTALAHKHLAFIYCTSQRESACVAAFKAARLADPKFALSPTEAGHPMWAQVYRKALNIKP